MDKAEVLAALYNASKPQGLGLIHYDATPMTTDEARKLLQKGARFDYLRGRIMKINLEKDDVDTWGYNRDNGENAAEFAVESLQSTQDPNNIGIRVTHVTGASHSVQEMKELLHEDPSIIESDCKTVTIHLGFSDMADRLKPAITRAESFLKSPLE